MNFVINNNKSEAIYVDKVNNHVANSDEIIKIKANSNISVIDKYIAIITAGLYLNKVEVAIIKYLINNNGAELNEQICITVAKEVNKSTATIARAISSLRYKRLVYLDNTKTIKLSSTIIININTLSKSKFFVVEVNPKVTSYKIEL